MARHVMVGDLRVQQIERKDGRRSQRRAERAQRCMHSRRRRPRTESRKNTATVFEPRAAAALAARRRKTDAALERVHQAIARLRHEKAQVSVAAIARRADVSRTILYDNVEARTAVAAAMAQAGEHQSRTLAEQDAEHEATWHERALNTEDALKATHAEILAQRTRIGELLGRIRNLGAEWTEEAMQRSTTENAALKQRVRQLTADNRPLDERLKAARSNLRFQDRRIADFEARLADPLC
ncbi:DUF6262 family protein [Streptomyces sp. NPDC050549]|uniref:DUF6262 family protein n=1 Tax=Streptomyces sp. NPDC050549 TaxID=3155406 RepID=UPI003436A186